VEFEEGPDQWLLRNRFRRQQLAGGGCKGGTQGIATKSDLGDVGDWKADALDRLACRSISPRLPAGVEGDPEIAVAVDRRSVGMPFAGIDPDERA